MGFTGTPAAEYCEAEVMARFDEEIIGIGQYNRRKIAGSASWSQHSWGNALDLHMSVGRADAAERANGDKIAKWLRDNSEALGVRGVLWWVKSHYNHIHVDFWPQGHVTPPLSTTGTGYFRYSDGRIQQSQIQTIPKEGPGLGDDDMPAPKDWDAEDWDAFNQKIGAFVWGGDYTIPDPANGGQRIHPNTMLRGIRSGVAWLKSQDVTQLDAEDLDAIAQAVNDELARRAVG